MFSQKQAKSLYFISLQQNSLRILKPSAKFSTLFALFWGGGGCSQRLVSSPPVLEFLNNLWGRGTELEKGRLTGSPGYTA
jgi:hypothetical protein